MVHIIRILAVCLIVLTALCSKCGEEKSELRPCFTECEQDGEKCLSWEDSPDIFYCRMLCNSDEDCPQGESCEPEPGAYYFDVCGDDLKVCHSNDGNDDNERCYRNCREDETCLFSGNKFDSYYCFVPCDDDGDCPSGQSCKRNASSCATCMDIRYICQ